MSTTHRINVNVRKQDFVQFAGKKTYRFVRLRVDTRHHNVIMYANFVTGIRWSKLRGAMGLSD